MSCRITEAEPSGKLFVSESLGKNFIQSADQSVRSECLSIVKLLLDPNSLRLFPGEFPSD
jgi:hypothetical protein